MNTSKRERNETILIRPFTLRNIIYLTQMCALLFLQDLCYYMHTLIRHLSRHQLVYRRIRRHFYIGYTYIYDTTAGGRNIYVNIWVGGGVFSEKDLLRQKHAKQHFSSYNLDIVSPCNIYSFILLFQMRNKLFSYFISVIARCRSKDTHRVRTLKRIQCERNHKTFRLECWPRSKSYWAEFYDSVAG